MKRLIDLCLQSLHHHFVAWTKSDTSSLPALDTDRPFPEQVRVGGRKCTVTSATYHPEATGETTCLYQDGPHPPRASGQDGTSLETGPRHCPAGDTVALASPGFQALLEIQVEGSFSHAKDLAGDHLLDSEDGQRQSPVGSRAHSWRITQTGHPRLQTHHSKVHEWCSLTKTARTDLGHLPAHAYQRHLGV